MELSRPLTVVEGGAEAIDEDEAPTLTPAAWERFNAGAVWCSLESPSGTLRFAVNRPHAVLEVQPAGQPRERVVVPATLSCAWFWSACGLHSSRPFVVPELDYARYLDDPEGSADARLRVGRQEEVLRDEFLFQHASGWMRARRVQLDEDEPTVLIDGFDMRGLVRDLSILLAESLLPD